MHDLAVTGGTVLTDGAARRAHVYCDGARIAAVTGERRPARRSVDAAGLLVCPGLIDLHLNGAMGLDFTSGTLAPLPQFEGWLLRHGVTGYLAALNTDQPERRLAHLAAAAEVVAVGQPDRPTCLGFYLEGPHYAESQRGAHDAALMHDPTVAEGEAALAASGDRVRVWSLAPERAGSAEFIAWLRARGVVPAIGHSAATYDQVGTAVAAGAGLVTHAYACLTAFTGAGPSKQLGGNEGALSHDALVLEVLADGMHLTGSLVRWIVAVAGWRRLCLTTDAMAAAGLGDGVYHFLGAKTHVVGGRAYRPDRTHFAGSTADLPSCLRHLVAAGLTPAEAVATATVVPARLLGDPIRGRVVPGAVADLVLFDHDFAARAVLVAGRPVDRGP